MNFREHLDSARATISWSAEHVRENGLPRRGRKLYLNVYDMEQRYGGPEEGGWWYDVYHPVSSQGFSGRRKDRQRMARLMVKLENFGATTNMSRRDYHSVLSEGRMIVSVESKPAQLYPTCRPSYC